MTPNQRTCSPATPPDHPEPLLRSHRTRTARNSAAYLLPSLRAGQRLLDVGSGPGTITADLAELVAPGRLVALETSDEILSLTRAEVEVRCRDNVDYLVGDIHALDLPDDSFDVVRAHEAGAGQHHRLGHRNPAREQRPGQHG